ncbi:MAG: ShlB/FhaC/HecB family hemolysin secretion/activation protein [Cyanobacteria bacterium P01_D01_bin.36]
MGKITGYSFFSLAFLGLWAKGTGAIAVPLPEGIPPEDIPQNATVQLQQDSLVDLQIRLPAELPLPPQTLENTDSISPQVELQLSSFLTNNSLSVDFSSCDVAYQCLNGQITTEHTTPASQAKFQHYHDSGSPITLAPSVRGFWLSGNDATGGDAAPSVMWQQDGQLYTVHLPAAGRQDVLYFAHSVANSPLLTQQHLQENISHQQQIASVNADAVSIDDVPEESVVLPIRIESVEVSPELHLAADIETLVAPLVAREIMPEELALVANGISQQYQSQGFLTSSAIAPAAAIANELQETNKLVIGRNAAGIAVNEDIITPDEISVRDVDENPLNPGAADFIQDRLSLALGTNEPVHFDRLEDQLRLLREDPLFENVEANLTSLSAREDGEPRLAVRATQADPFALGVRLDNGSPVSTGGEQATVSLSQRNMFRFGDQLSSSYNISSTAGIRKYAFGYRVPLNAMNGSLSIGVNSTTSKVTQAPFDALGIRGDSRQYSLNLRQPLVRSPRQEFALSLGFSHTSGQTFLFNDLAQPFGFGPDANGRSQVSTLTFGQQYLSRDSGGAWSFNSEFNLGVDWLGATVNEAPVPDGRFFSWLGQVSRSQRAGDNHLFILQADMQLTPDSLLPSEQFVVGGIGSVRGYRQNLRSGDNGLRLSIEDRVAVSRDSAGRPEVFITPFVEGGAVWQTGGNPNQLPEQNLLLGTGVGLLWQNAFKLSDFNLRVDYGLPLIQLTDRGNNLQDSAIHFSVDYEI